MPVKLFSILLLLSAGACMAQQPCESRAWVSGKCLPFCADGQISGSCAQRDVKATMKAVKTPFSCVGNICTPNPAPLKCGKYEHVEFDEEADAIAIPESRHPFHKVPGSERCAPDLHTVTEKEWQEITHQLHCLQEAWNRKELSLFDKSVKNCPVRYPESKKGD